MANKNNVITDKVRLSDMRWINTPFAFARVGKDFSLMQQNIMIKVSDHLQEYITKFFKDKRNLSPDDPLSLFDTNSMPDIPVLKIPYCELCDDVNNRYKLYKDIEEVTKCRIKALIIDNGVLKMAWAPVFEIVATDVQASDREYRTGFCEFKINRSVAAYAFNMRLGYVNHPVTIARDSTKVYAPRLYFLIKHKLGRSRNEVTIKYSDLRDELGMNEIDKNECSTPDTIIKTLYPQFAKFKKWVLDPAIEDINRMADLNLLDITINYRLIPDNLERGNPDAIVFQVSLSKLGLYHKNPNNTQQDNNTPKTDVQTKKRGRPKKSQTIDTTPSLFDAVEQPSRLLNDKSNLWTDVLNEYNGRLKDRLLKCKYLGTNEGKPWIQFPSYIAMLDFENEKGQDELIDIVKRIYGLERGSIKKDYPH